MSPLKAGTVRVKDIRIKGAHIGFRNFKGKANEVNPEGNRVFAVFLDTPFATQLMDEGWNIKWPKPNNDPDDERQPYLSVKVSFDNRPPTVQMITSGNKTILDADTIEVLDWAEIENVDVVITPYNWEMRGKSGIKAYLKAIYVTIVEDEFEKKYRDIPTSSSSKKVEEPDAPWEG